MKNKFSSNKIQKDLMRLTGHKYSIKYINNTYKKIFENIILSNKKKFLIAGSQGCGKTTLLKLININFEKFYNIKTLCISLDDFYLSKKQRKQYVKLGEIEKNRYQEDMEEYENNCQY